MSKVVLSEGTLRETCLMMYKVSKRYGMNLSDYRFDSTDAFDSWNNDLIGRYDTPKLDRLLDWVRGVLRDEGESSAFLTMQAAAEAELERRRSESSDALVSHDAVSRGTGDAR